MGGGRAVLTAGLVYFAVVFAIAFVLGAARTFLLEPHVSKLVATASEAPLLLAAMVWAAAWVPPRFGLVGRRFSLIGAGVVALILQQAADAGLGLVLRGLTLAEQYAQFARPEGWLFAALLVAFVLAPLALHGARAR